MMNKLRHQGFSLVELMIVVVIISILAAIAIPQYSDYVLKAKLAEAYSALSTAQLKMEQYYQDNRTYARATACTAPASDCGICPSSFTGLKSFGLTCATTTIGGSAGQGFIYTATSSGLGSPEFIFTVNEAATKATTQVPGGWTANAACWVRGKGGC